MSEEKMNRFARGIYENLLGADLFDETEETEPTTSKFQPSPNLNWLLLAGIGSLIGLGFVFLLAQQKETKEKPKEIKPKKRPIKKITTTRTIYKEKPVVKDEKPEEVESEETVEEGDVIE